MGLKFKDYISKQDKQRIINAVAGEPVDRVPNFEILIEDKIVEKIMGRHIGGSAVGNLGNYLNIEDSLKKANEFIKDIEVNNEERPVYARDYIE